MNRKAYWDLKSSSLDKATFDIINRLLIAVFNEESEGITFPENKDNLFLYLEHSGKRDWVWRDPILANAEDDILFYSGEIPIPDDRKIDNLGEISIHESYIEDGMSSIYYQMYIWCWKNLDDLGGCIVLDGFIEGDIGKLGDQIVQKLGFVQTL